MERKRRTERILARIPLRVRGIDQFGHPFLEDVTTVVINRDGARIRMQSVPRFGTKLEITNLSNKMTAPFLISEVCPECYTESPEWGVKLSNAVPDFWGIAFEEREEGNLVISALVFCNLCARQEMIDLSQSEYERLSEANSLPRSCVACGSVTQWEVVATEEEVPGESLQETSGRERRRARRLALKVPVFVSTTTGSSEVTQTDDLSRTGMSFLSSLDLEIGTQVAVTVGHGVSRKPTVRNCRVIRRQPEGNGKRRRYGVHFVDVLGLR